MQLQWNLTYKDYGFYLIILIMAIRCKKLKGIGSSWWQKIISIIFKIISILSLKGACHLPCVSARVAEFVKGIPFFWHMMLYWWVIWHMMLHKWVICFRINFHFPRTCLSLNMRTQCSLKLPESNCPLTQHHIPIQWNRQLDCCRKPQTSQWLWSFLYCLNLINSCL